MKRVILASAAVAAFAVAARALAQQAQQGPLSGAYGTLGYGHVDAGANGLGTVQGRLGYKFAPFFGVEGEGALGVDTDRGTVGGVAVDQKVKRSVGAYAVGVAPLSPNLELFVRGGYGSTRFKTSTAATSVTTKRDSWNYGGGAQYFFDGQNGLRADYTREDFRHNRGHADVWGVSFVRRF